MAATWTVTANGVKVGTSLDGTFTMEWRADGVLASDPPTYSLSRTGVFDSSAKVALYTTAFAGRDAFVAKAAFEATAAGIIETGLNNNDPGVT